MTHGDNNTRSLTGGVTPVELRLRALLLLLRGQVRLQPGPPVAAGRVAVVVEASGRRSHGRWGSFAVAQATTYGSVDNYTSIVQAKKSVV